MIKDTAVHLGKLPRGVLQISSDRHDWGIFGGFEMLLSISGFFWVGKFWQVFPQVAWFKKGFFWVSKTTVSVFRVILFNAIWKSLRLVDSAWDFLRFQVLPPFDHPCHLKSGVPPPASYPRGKLKGAQCSEPVKSKKNNIIKSRFSSCQEEKQLGARGRSGRC